MSWERAPRSAMNRQPRLILRLSVLVSTNAVASSVVTHPGAAAAGAWNSAGNRRPNLMSDQPLVYTSSALAAAMATAIRAGLALARAITRAIAAPTVSATGPAVKP